MSHEATERPDRARETLLPALGFTALALFFTRGAAIGGDAFFERDVHLMWYAQMKALRAAVSEGSWPFWNPWIGLGQPLWADANNQVLYPTTLLQAMLPPWHAYTALVVVHLALAGMGGYVLARRLQLSRGPAFVAGAIWLASGPLLSLVRAWNLLAAAAWIPWGAAAAEAATRGRSSARTAVAWGTCLAMPILAGGPEMLLAGLVLQAAVIAARVGGSRDALRKVALRGAAAAAFALALAAGQWLPSLDAARRSGRAALPEVVRTYWSEHPARLGEWVLPWTLSPVPAGHPLRDRLFEGRDPFLPSIYMGAIATALAAAAWLARARLATALAAVAVLSTLVALGRHTPVYGWAVALVPPLGLFRYPAKALVLASAGAAFLAALGLEALAAGDERTRRRSRRCVAGGVALLAVVPALALASGTFRFLTGASLWAGAALVLLALATWATARMTAARALAVLGALVVLDLGGAHARLNPTAPTALYRAPAPVLAQLPPEPGARVFAFDYLQPGLGPRLLGTPDPYRIVRAPAQWSAPAAHALGLRWALFPPTAAATFLSGSFDTDVPVIAPAETAALAQVARQVEGPAFVRLLQFGAVGSVVSLHQSGLEGLVPAGSAPSLLAEAVRVWRVPDALPRASVVGGAEVAAGPEALVRALHPSFDFHRAVVVDRGSPRTAPVDYRGTARLVRMTTDRTVVEVETTAEAHVVLADAFDPAWRARVDGSSAEMKRANGVFRAVAVPAGRHRVELVYRPAVIWVGLGITAVALAAGAVVALRRRTDA
jgi:hypothetical protein